jgi:hypothetical protein
LTEVYTAYVDPVDTQLDPGRLATCVEKVNFDSRLVLCIASRTEGVFPPAKHRVPAGSAMSESLGDIYFGSVRLDGVKAVAFPKMRVGDKLEVISPSYLSVDPALGVPRYPGPAATGGSGLDGARARTIRKLTLTTSI